MERDNIDERAQRSIEELHAAVKRMNEESEAFEKLAERELRAALAVWSATEFEDDSDAGCAARDMLNPFERALGVDRVREICNEHCSQLAHADEVSTDGR